jgi:site-specific DNA-methyltransferase (adenine-specific)
METAVSRELFAPYYDANGITLYCGNFEQILPQLGDRTFDALITDPPYGTTDIAWDQPVQWPLFWNEARRLCKPSAPLVLFAAGKFVYQLISSNQKQYRYELIWEKNNPVGHLDANRRPLRSHENVLIFSQVGKGGTYNPQMIKGKPHVVGMNHKSAHYGRASGNVVKRTTDLYHPRSILRIQNRSGAKSLHPTQKPLELMKWLVLSYSNRNDTILEPFAGSGSTLAACANHGRKAIGIEQSEEYCAIIAERLERG